MSVPAPFIGLPSYLLPSQSFQEEVTFPSVAATTDLAVAVQGSVWSYVLGFVVGLTTSALITTRIPEFQILDASGNIVGMSDAPNGQAASQTALYNFQPNLSTSYGALNQRQWAQIPQLVAPSGYTIRVILLNAVAGDTWTGTLTLLQIPTGNIDETSTRPLVTPTPILL